MKRAEDVSTDARSTVSLIDLARNLPAMALDAPGMLRNALGMLVTADSKSSVGLYFQRNAHRHPDRVFLRFEGAAYTYGEANAQVNRYASVLAARGVGRGDVVGVLMTNRPETMFVVLATVKLGATVGLLNHHQRDRVLAHSFGLLDSVLNVVGAECADAIDSLPEPPTIVTRSRLPPWVCRRSRPDAPTREDSQATRRASSVANFLCGDARLPSNCPS
uniref:AMP-binding protein n=1 Tax=Nocardia abscessus TaxID=120957 RepID=UPI002454FB52